MAVPHRRQPGRSTSGGASGATARWRWPTGPAAARISKAALPDQRLADPYQQTQSHEIGDRVQQAINELTPDHKAVILLREVEGLSYDDISRVMQCSKGTVMSRLHYARKKLQKKLKDCI